MNGTPNQTRALIWILSLATVFVATRSWLRPAAETGAREEAETNRTTIMAPAADPVETGFAIVELFTSQGCSSCPPADKLLGEIAGESRKDGIAVIPLAFHVDYWNKLGWRDPLSDITFSEYQFAYGRSFELKSVYTPQMIVNGTAEFIGSDAKEARQRIQGALARQAEVDVTLQAQAHPDTNIVDVSYEIEGTEDQTMNVRIALVEREVTTKVRAGENAGRTLTHENVVRVLRTIPLKKGFKGKTVLKAPKEMDRRQGAVVAYVQDPKTMAIKGATLLDLP